jgi:hypothetical protein
VAISVVECRAILAIAWTFSGGHGSSMNRTFRGSTSLTRTEATLGQVLVWRSTAMSMSRPKRLAQHLHALDRREIFLRVSIHS